MSRTEFTYEIKHLVSAVIIWELISIVVIHLAYYFLGYHSNSNSEHLSFKYPNLLLLELLAIFLAGVLINSAVKFNASMAEFGVFKKTTFFNSISTKHLIVKYIFLRIAFSSLIISMAQPFYGSQKVKASIESLELVIALDVSNSMNTKDIDKEMSRLNISKRAIIQLINNLHGEKIGLTIFAGSSYVQLPITSDYNAAKMFVNEVETGMISNQGTNIAAALQTSISMFSKAKTSKAIILVTDGENHEENPDVIYEALKESEIQLCVLGIGTEQGGLVPNNPSRPELGYKQTASGNPVQSKLSVEFIKEIADKVNGVGVVSSSPYPDLKALLEKINNLKRTKIDDLEFNVKDGKYQYSLMISLVFWLVYLFWNRKLTDSLTFIKKR